MGHNIQLTTFSEPFITESGSRLSRPIVAWQSWGKLNKNRDNVVVICHALTGNTAADEWFSGLFGKDGALNPDEQFIICANVPGSCYGSTGPWSENPETGTPYRTDFPELTIRDLVRFQQQLLDELGVTGIELVIGGSMGGMQVLEFAVMDSRVRRAVPIAVGKAHTPWQIGISHVQRQAIYKDPNWKNGNYPKDQPPADGLSIARQMAMISYRSPDDYEQKFGRTLQDGSDIYQVESYLNYQGRKLCDRFDALSYIYLTKAMDSHDISRGRPSHAAAINQITIPVQVIGINSDVLYPTEEQKELARLLPNARYKEITSPHGHDAFLIDFDQINQIVAPFLNTTLTTEAN